jgi:hypothetical protein
LVVLLPQLPDVQVSLVASLGVTVWHDLQGQGGELCQ